MDADETLCPAKRHVQCQLLRQLLYIELLISNWSELNLAAVMGAQPHTRYSLNNFSYLLINQKHIINQKHNCHSACFTGWLPNCPWKYRTG